MATGGGQWTCEMERAQYGCDGIIRRSKADDAVVGAEPVPVVAELITLDL